MHDFKWPIISKRTRRSTANRREAVKKLNGSLFSCGAKSGVLGKIVQLRPKLPREYWIVRGREVKLAYDGMSHNTRQHRQQRVESWEKTSATAVSELPHNVSEFPSDLRAARLK